MTVGMFGYRRVRNREVEHEHVIAIANTPSLNASVRPVAHRFFTPALSTPDATLLRDELAEPRRRALHAHSNVRPTH
jgi:hypothetical protein